MIKRLLKRIIPAPLLLLYHKVFAMVANVVYRFPSKELIVIGVTGTNGKSTTSNLIAKVLEGRGDKVGLMTTVLYKIAEKEWLNSTRMTMLGRFKLQKMLREMVRAGCRYVVIETSSEGIMQNRNWGIRYDVAVFTNLTPEHIEAHGSFENYKIAKGKLFSLLDRYPHKIFDGHEVDKASVVNLDDEYAAYFASFPADKKYRYTVRGGTGDGVVVHGMNPRYTVSSTTFVVEGTTIELQLVGEFNVYNALAALCVGKHFGFDMSTIKKQLESVAMVPGRMEIINEGQPYSVLVDYAHDLKSFEILFDTLNLFEKKRVIHVFGSAGGVRDHVKRPGMGAFSAEHADITIITDEDSYDEPVEKILNEIAQGAIIKGKEMGRNVFTIPDRKEAIRKACELAQPGDMVLITGKGTEQSIKSNGVVLPWDDRVAAREVIQSLRNVE